MEESRIPKSLQDVLVDKGPQERHEEDWTMPFREM